MNNTNISNEEIKKIVDDSIKELILTFKQVNETGNRGFTSEGDTQAYLYSLLVKNSNGKLIKLIELEDEKEKKFYDLLMHSEYKINNKRIDVVIHDAECFEIADDILIAIELKFDHYNKILSVKKHSVLKDILILNKILKKGNQIGYSIILNYNMEKSKSIEKKRNKILSYIEKNKIDTDKIRIYYFALFEDSGYEYYRIKKEGFINLNENLI